MTHNNSEHFSSLLNSFMECFIENSPSELEEKTILENPEYKKIRALKGRAKADFVIYLNHYILDTLESKENSSHIAFNLSSVIMKSKVHFTADDIICLFEFYKRGGALGKTWMNFNKWPIGQTVSFLGQAIKKIELTDEQQKNLKDISGWPEFVNTFYLSGPNLRRDYNRFIKILETKKSEGEVEPYKMLGGDGFGKHVQSHFEITSDDERNLWYRLFHICAEVSGGKPNKKFVTSTNAIIEDIGVQHYKKLLHDWLTIAVSLPLSEAQHPDYPEHTIPQYLTPRNMKLLKGLVWTLVRFHDKQTISLISDLTESTYKSITYVGPIALGLGNACIFTLAHSSGLEGISYLTRLKIRLKQKSAKKLIQKYIDEQARKKGLHPAHLEERAVKDFGLVEGQRTEEFNDYKLQIQLSDTGKVENLWFKPDGTPQKTVPAFVKSSSKLSASLKNIRSIISDIKKASSTQRERIDRLFSENIDWSYHNLMQYYINHGLVSNIARRLIWSFEASGDMTSALYINGEWQNSEGATVKVDENSKITLWHPIFDEIENVLAWRKRLDALEIQQPFKQAYREIYLLTDAEINTRTYSNRMAAHILMQNQLASLAAVRGWRYNLLGSFHAGSDGNKVIKSVPAYELTAEYFVTGVPDDDGMGTWECIATDLIRFVNNEGNPIDLNDVPPIVLSEVMRDVDLFVGVASIGNNPDWQDRGGNSEHDDYWHSYSFGELAEVARTRKEVLKNLIPRLKIKDVVHIDGRYLIVDGKRHTYKIHIGSTNILIAPHNQYLCIIPNSSKDRRLDSIHLPFEGDRALSLILSKAFMLAADDKIKDETILSQLH